MSVTRVVHFSFPFLVHYCIPIDRLTLGMSRAGHRLRNKKHQRLIPVGSMPLLYAGLFLLLFSC